MNLFKSYFINFLNSSPIVYHSSFSEHYLVLLQNTKMKSDYIIFTLLLLFVSGVAWCEDISPETLLSLPEPIILGDVTVCADEKGVVYQLGNNLDPGLTYSWSVNDGTIIGPSDTTFIVVDWFANVGGAASTVQVTVSNTDCTVSNILPVLIYFPEAFTFEIISDGNFICAGDTVTFVAVPSVLTLNTDTPSYTWYVNDVPVGTNDSTYVFINAMDGDVVRCEAKIGPYCVLNTEAVSNEVPMDVTSFSDSNIFIAAAQDTICEGDNASFTAITMPSFGWMYQWRVNGVDVGFGNPSYTGVGMSNGDEVVCIATNNSCQGSTPVSDTVIVNAQAAFPASLTIEADINPICVGDTVTFTSMAVNEGDSPNYQWQVNGANVAYATGNTFEAVGLMGGDIVTCTMISSSNCATEPIVFSNSIIMETATGLQTSVVLTANPNPFCEGDAIDFTAAVSNPAPNPNFTWFINGSQFTSDNDGMETISNLNNADVVSVTYDADFDECFQQGKLSDTIVLSGQDAIPISVTLSADRTQICAGENVMFIPIPVNGGTDPEYDWFLNGNPLNINTDTFITDNVAKEMTTSLTCPLNDDSTAMSNALMIQVSDLTLDIVSLIPACNEQGMIEVEASGGIFDNYSYLWSNDQTGPIASGLGAGAYAVTVIDQIGCTDDIIGIDVAEVDAPEILSASISIASCGMADGSITVDVAGGLLPYEYVWTNESGTVSTDLQQPMIAGGTYTLSVTDDNDCYVTETYTVPEETAAAVVAPEDVTIDLGDSIRIVAYGETLESVDYLWSPPVGVSCLTCPITYLMPIETTTYVLTLTEEGGCTSSDSLTVTVRDSREVFIPNVFSPNFDDNNDIYTVFAGAGVAQIKAFRIYNRWGALLHSVANVSANDNRYGWDGSFNGEQQPIGVYVYYVELEFINGTIKNYQGDLTLVR